MQEFATAQHVVEASKDFLQREARQRAALESALEQANATLCTARAMLAADNDDVGSGGGDQVRGEATDAAAASALAAMEAAQATLANADAVRRQCV